jgi:hypothetical protein
VLFELSFVGTVMALAEEIGFADGLLRHRSVIAERRRRGEEHGYGEEREAGAHELQHGRDLYSY